MLTSLLANIDFNQEFIWKDFCLEDKEITENLKDFFCMGPHRG